MRIEQNIFKQLSFKLSVKALIISLILLATLQIYADEKNTNINIAKAEEAAAKAAVVIAQNLLSKIEIIKAETNESTSLIFRAPIYKVKPVLGYVSILDGEVQDLNKPSSSVKLPGYLKLIRDDFVLDSEKKAEILASAIEPLIPYKLKKIVKPVKVDHGWIIFRGKFFKNYSGIIFTTNEQGKVTLVEYVLKIDPKDYSYKKPEY